MYIFLPPAGYNQSISSLFTGPKLEKQISQLAVQKVNLSLPKFTLSQTYSLVNVMQNIGIIDAFSTKADFSDINGGKNLHINDLVHQIFVEVNEEGTEAATTTGLVIEQHIPSSQLMTEEINFHVDRPFMILIREKKHALTLFAGIVNHF